MKLIHALAAAALLLAACSKVSADNYARIEPGMDREQVHQILGKPDEVNGASIGPLSLSTEVWKGRQQVITITFTGSSVGLKSIESTEPKN
jgi:hypothetical protein